MAKNVQIGWHGARVKRSERAGAAQGLTTAMEHLLGEAQAVVPHETGDLERSGRASVDETNLRGCVSFDTPYAVRQHEEIGWQHNGGRQAKYLEEPMETEGPYLGDLIAAGIRRSLR